MDAFSLSCLIAVPSTSNFMLNESDESGQPCLVPDFKENTFSFLLLSMMLAVRLSYIAFIMLRYVPSIPTLLRVFIISGYWILSDVFFLHLLNDYMIFTFPFVYVAYC